MVSVHYYLYTPYVLSQESRILAEILCLFLTFTSVPLACKYHGGHCTSEHYMILWSLELVIFCNNNILLKFLDCQFKLLMFMVRLTPRFNAWRPSCQARLRLLSGLPVRT
jgi:hypothetical protein